MLFCFCPNQSSALEAKIQPCFLQYMLLRIPCDCCYSMCIYASKIHACIHCSEVWKDSSYPPSTPISQEARESWNSRYAYWRCISEKYLLPRVLKLFKVSMRCSVPSNHCKILLIWGLSLAEACPGITLNALRFFLLFQIQELFLWSANERPCFERLVNSFKSSRDLQEL